MNGLAWDKNDLQLLAKLAMPVRRLAAIIRRGQGARIGQSTVVSQKVHTFNPLTPQIINVLQDADAGQAFYQRTQPGEIYHLDIFHQRALIEPQLIAAALKQAVEAYNFQSSVNNILYTEDNTRGINADFIDIQTGKGGGRITGNLRCGRKLSLRRAHENHVHIVLMVQPEHLAFLFYCVMAVETAILANHFELRRNERIINVRGQGKGKPDLEPYTDQSDSFMQQKSGGQNMSSTVRQHKLAKDAMALSESFDSIQEARDFVNRIHEEDSRQVKRELERAEDGQRLLERLTGMGIIEADGKSVRLTAYGVELQKYLNGNLLEIEAQIRNSYRMIKPLFKQNGKNKLMNFSYVSQSGYSAGPIGCNDKGELAVAETVTAAARRMLTDKQTVFRIEAADLQYLLREQVTKAEVCVLIDASGSMTGERIRAAKFLVRHLLLTHPDRIGVVTFQENRATILTPLTRDYREIETGLREIKAAGATPLALGIKACLNYLAGTRTHNPVILLITDGLPTMADCSRDPVADALEAARAIKRQKCRFVCIGLKSHRSYLTSLAECAGGSSYMLEELEKQNIVKTVLEECEKN